MKFIPTPCRPLLAAEAAARQGKFWEMHDLILESQRALGPDELIAHAHLLGLDLEQFSRNMESPSLSERVREDFMSGVRSGVNGTPTFFINGQRHNGPADFDSVTSCRAEVLKGALAAGRSKPERQGCIII